MGTPKIVLPFGKSTVVGTVIQNLLDAEVEGAILVTRRELADALGVSNDPRVQREFVNTEEMIDSIRAGLRWVDCAVGAAQDSHVEGDGVLVLPADMPAVSITTIRTCISAFIEHPRRIVIATCEGRRGHPMIFPYEMRPDVDRVVGGLRELLSTFEDRIHTVELPDQGIFADIDTRDQYIHSLERSLSSVHPEKSIQAF